jgi:hypothetical protein
MRAAHAPAAWFAAALYVGLSACRMFFGDGRFAYVDIDNPRSFMFVGD